MDYSLLSSEHVDPDKAMLAMAHAGIHVTHATNGTTNKIIAWFLILRTHSFNAYINFSNFTIILSARLIKTCLPL